MQRRIGLVLAITACAAAAACAAPAAPPSSTSTPATPAAAEFWAAHRAPGLEANPATSLFELQERAASIVVGPIVESQAGPDVPVGMDDGTVDPNGTTVLTVDVDRTLKGQPASQARVWISGTNGESSDRLPAGDYVWFLTPSETPGVDYLVSQTGLVGPLGTAAPEAVLDLGLTPDIVPAGVDDVPQLVQVIADRVDPAPQRVRKPEGPATTRQHTVAVATATVCCGNRRWAPVIAPSS
jgi:hypothetical protein